MSKLTEYSERYGKSYDLEILLPLHVELNKLHEAEFLVETETEKEKEQWLAKKT